MDIVTESMKDMSNKYKKIVYWIANDGTKFDDEDECAYYVDLCDESKVLCNAFDNDEKVAWDNVKSFLNHCSKYIETTKQFIRNKDEILVDIKYIIDDINNEKLRIADISKLQWDLWNVYVVLKPMQKFSNSLYDYYINNKIIEF